MSKREKVVFFMLAILMAISACIPGYAQDQPANLNMQTPAQGTSTSRPPPNPDAGWHFSLTPYLWFAGAHGTVSLANRAASVHASPGDLLSHFNFGIMGAAEARYNRFILYGDLLWIRLSDSAAIPIGVGATSADARVGQLVWTSKIGYRVINQEKLKFDADIGARFWHLGEKLNFNPSTLGLNVTGSQNWADIVLGGRVQLPMSKKTIINLAGDVGGWGATANLDYQFLAVLGYQVAKKWTLEAGYRYLFVDYRPSTFSSYNMVTSGAIVGFTYKFK
jgi:hypothetical protein